LRLEPLVDLAVLIALVLLYTAAGRVRLGLMFALAGVAMTHRLMRLTLVAEAARAC
jgi:hypothetical protein